MAARTRPITHDDLRGLPGLRSAAADALVASQPATVLDALQLPDVGRKTTKQLLALGLITDPHGGQEHSMAQAVKTMRRQ